PPFLPRTDAVRRRPEAGAGPDVPRRSPRRARRRAAAGAARRATRILRPQPDPAAHPPGYDQLRNGRNPAGHAPPGRPLPGEADSRCAPGLEDGPTWEAGQDLRPLSPPTPDGPRLPALAHQRLRGLHPPEPRRLVPAPRVRRTGRLLDAPRLAAGA